MFENQINQPVPPGNLPTEPDDIFSSVDKTPVAPSQAVSAPEAAARPNALDAGVLKPKATVAVATMPQEGAEDGATEPMNVGEVKTHTPIIGKIVIIVVILFVIAGLGFAGWWAYHTYFASATLPSSSAVREVPLPSSLAPAETAPTIPTLPEPPAVTDTTGGLQKDTNDAILFGEPVDTDHDSLSDAQEKELGTDGAKADTDGDGLTDGEEVMVNHTNALNPDTDGDGLTDGEEVQTWHTNPSNPDTDGDSYADGKEVKNGYNPLGHGKMLASTTTPSTATSSAKAAVSSSIKVAATSTP